MPDPSSFPKSRSDRWRILILLQESSLPLTALTICQSLDPKVTQDGVLLALGQLVEQGWIEAVPVQRGIRIGWSLTPAGKAQLSQDVFALMDD